MFLLQSNFNEFSQLKPKIKKKYFVVKLRFLYKKSDSNPKIKVLIVFTKQNLSLKYIF